MAKSLATNILACFLAYLLTPVLADNNVVETDKGLIRGKEDVVLGKTIYQFLGVPYAEPPIGARRFKRAVPIQSKWEKTRESIQFQASCPQQRLEAAFFERTDPNDPSWQLNEDCLYLNIMTPSLKSSDKLPVIFWIHGGSLRVGNAAWWHGQTLASQENVVVVSINYRLGSLGFLTVQDSDGNTVIDANIGLLDQHLALTWVRDNIAAFGGDPTNVVIAGHSAGSISATYHMISPQSRGLFRSAALYGGTCLLKDVYYTKWSDSNRVFDLFRSKTSCNDSHFTPQQSLECLQKLSTEDLLTAQHQASMAAIYPFRPIVDSYFLPDDPALLISQGSFNPVNVIIGTTANDGAVFSATIPGYEQGFPGVLLNQMVYGFYHSYPDEIRSLIVHHYTDYSLPNDLIKNRQMVDQFLTEALFQAPVDELAIQLAKRGYPAFVFIFDQKTEQSAYYPSYSGVIHQMEIPYIYGYPLHHPDYVKDNYTEDDRQVSINMMKIIGGLARNGKPEVDVDWQPYSSSNKSYLHIKNPLKIEKNYLPQATIFWNKVIPSLIDRSDSDAQMSFIKCQLGNDKLRKENRNYFYITVGSLAFSFSIILLVQYLNKDKNKQD
ncbi:Acetylcholinesterase [Trichoplax sp. H2]|nr:Acetylcholinesterase [Trichoplax sp. H2]|eukprot:RDD40151.1 Acetylcholinesterase [Trichoplax sp. H2]